MKSERKNWIKKALEAFKENKIVIIQGLRRIGKSVLLDSLLSIDKNDKKIKYVCGLLGSNDENWFLDIIKESKINEETLYHLYVDEFQDYKDWKIAFKTIYDTCKNIKIIATGSISSNINLISETEGGRFKYLDMPILSFEEYTMINKKQYNMDTFTDYASIGSYPQTFNNIINYKAFISENIFEKIRNSSLLKRADIANDENVLKVLLFIIDNIGQTISSNSIANKLNINIRTVDKIINYLKMTFIIYEINNNKVSKGRAAISNKKYYLTDHTFFLFLENIEYEHVDANKKSFIFENIIFNHLKINFNKYEAKFGFIKKGNEDIDIYINYQNKIFKFDIKNSNSITSLSKNQNQIENLSIIYLGKTLVKNKRTYINVLEFIKNPQKFLKEY